MNEKIINLVSSVKDEQKIIAVSKSIINEKIEELERHVYKVIINLWKKHFSKKSDIFYEDHFLPLKETLSKDLRVGCFNEDWLCELYIYPSFASHTKYADKELFIYENKWYYNSSMDDYKEKIKEIGEDNFWNNLHDEFEEVKLNVTVEQFYEFLKDLNKETGLTFEYLSTMECSLEKLNGEIIS